MARHDWVKLKSKYLAGLYKDLKEFATKEKINYQVVRNNSKGWNEEKLQYNDMKVTKITQRTIDKVVEKEADRNAKHLAIQDLALDAIEEYLKNRHFKKHVIKYKYYDSEGKADHEELKNVELEVMDSRAFSNVVASLEKLQKGQRLALNMDKDNNEANDLVDDGFIDALKNEALDIWADEGEQHE